MRRVHDDFPCSVVLKFILEEVEELFCWVVRLNRLANLLDPGLHGHPMNNLQFACQTIQHIRPCLTQRVFKVVDRVIVRFCKENLGHAHCCIVHW